MGGKDNPPLPIPLYGDHRMITFMESKGCFVRCQKPLPQHWTNHAIGRSGVHLTSIVSSWSSETGAKGPEIRAELYLDGPNAKQEFAALEGMKVDIEKSLGFGLTWHNCVTRP